MSNEQCWKGLPPFDLLFLTTTPVHYLAISHSCNLAILHLTSSHDKKGEVMRTAKEIYEAAEQTIYDLVVDGKASATFDGRSYTAIDLEKLQKISDLYRNKAIANGEIEANPNTDKITVSYPKIPGRFTC